MSKYAQLRSLMSGIERYRLGGVEVFNDKVKEGRVLKWYADTCGATLAERKKMAAEIFEKLKGTGYVIKVNIRNATSTSTRFSAGGFASNTIADYDKICVYIDMEKLGNG